MIQDLLLSGRLFDLILIGIGLEIVLLGWIARQYPGTPRLGVLLPNLLSGAALMLAVRLAVTDSRWEWIAATLAASLAFHLIDLVKRYREE
ncbi:conserved hypothetical protein [Luminiphilus syltensis NOR5-1B]|uniref:Uncharacterized protein n=1 Tax=Luminiphilus syltensis NOR5-1B TaxID=565045 RepID=B8KT45_9GAMM|nr:hypothetical protein [Luminiphilus syltensis]EED36075.1 conserved hypothetical protein [Luminiphilus syltensis NOR5-1B]